MALTGASSSSRHGLPPFTVMGQCGQRVSASQFVRHGSAERGLPSFRRQRSRDRGNAHSMPPLSREAQPAGEHQRAEWADVITDLTDKVRNLEINQRKHANDISSMRSEFTSYKDAMQKDLRRILYDDDDSIKKRLDILDNQMLNEVPMAISTSTAHIDRRIGNIEAAMNAIVSEVSSRPHIPQHHNVATPAEPDIAEGGSSSLQSRSVGEIR